MKRGVKRSQRSSQRKRAPDVRKHLAHLHSRVSGMRARLSTRGKHPGKQVSGKSGAGKKPGTHRTRSGAKALAFLNHNIVALGWRALVWLAVVFALLPHYFDVWDVHKLFTFNSNVAGLFILALLGAFAIWRRNQLLEAEASFDLKTAVITLVLAAVVFALSFNAQVSYRPQMSYFDKALLIVWMQVSYAIGALLLAITLYGIKLFIKERHALLTGAVVGVSFVGSSLLFRQLWPILSNLVVGLNERMLAPFGAVETVLGPAPSLVLDGFGVVIGEACAGVDSAILFAGVFLFIALLDWPRLKHRLFIGMLPFGLIGMFLVNVVRVGLLMIVGANYSPEFALSMFHDNAGWVLFVIYTLGFWWWAYPRVVKGKNA